MIPRVTNVTLVSNDAKSRIHCHMKCENEGQKSIFLNMFLKFFKYVCIIVYYRHLIIPLVSLEFYISVLPQSVTFSLRKKENSLICDIEGINSLTCLNVDLGSLIIRILSSKREMGIYKDFLYSGSTVVSTIGLSLR